jgi:transposase
MIYDSGMSTTPNNPETVLEQATLAAHSATTVQELRRALSILLPALLGATIDQTAEAIGVGHATVSRLRAAFIDSASTHEATPKGTWGGRRNAWLSFEEEKEFLAPWLAKAEQGSLVVASPIREALAKRLDQPVKASVIYRMLERHDWRKVAPDTRHPKSDPAVQEAWKKKLPEDLGALLKPEVVKGRKVRLMLQDEARFGRMVKIRRCWAPAPVRPMVDNSYEREFTYVYGDVSPVEGEWDWMLCDKMNTEQMREFLAQVSAAHP